MYLFRLDDACEYMNIDLWDKVENLFDKYNIKPLVGIIPDCKDPQFLNAYKKDEDFWKKALLWQDKCWGIALHGYQHLYKTEHGGDNPVNNYSEFAGIPYEEQKSMINNGYNILLEYGLKPKFFFAPAHTFDVNTLLALQEETSIRIISDTIANDIYYKEPFYFMPQQLGSLKTLPLKFVTICLHPNSMDDSSVFELEQFIKRNSDSIINIDNIVYKKRRYNLLDYLLRTLYFMKRSVKRVFK